MKIRIVAVALLLWSQAAQADLITNPNDPRSFQGATVGTFAQLFYGANTDANRQLVVNNHLLDDGIFNTAGFIAGTLITSVGQYSGQGAGTSLDSTGTGGYAYTCCDAAATRFAAGSAVDNQWLQTSGVVGETVWDLGFQATQAAVFNTIDHGPLPLEAIESTVYLSNDRITWVQAVVERVWLQGFMPNLGIEWDGFTYAVGTGSSATFRYASIIFGGPGAFQNDGDNEINGIMGTRANFQAPSPVPEPETYALLMFGLAAVGWASRRRRTISR
ncbi:MAG: PEP-CTERM sorting domain-containing protein [Caldimonas sp.]